MSASFDINLGDEVSWVRFLIGDTTVATANFTDEEITANLSASTVSSAEAKRYLVAAELLDILHRRWMTLGAGYASKKVGSLSIAFGTGIGINVDAALQLKISQLRLEGSKRLSAAIGKPYAFRMM